MTTQRLGGLRAKYETPIKCDTMSQERSFDVPESAPLYANILEMLKVREDQRRAMRLDGRKTGGTTKYFESALKNCLSNLRKAPDS